MMLRRIEHMNKSFCKVCKCHLDKDGKGYDTYIKPRNWDWYTKNDLYNVVQKTCPGCDAKKIRTYIKKGHVKKHDPKDDWYYDFHHAPAEKISQFNPTLTRTNNRSNLPFSRGRR